MNRKTYYPFILILATAFGCQAPEQKDTPAQKAEIPVKNVEKKAFQTLIDNKDLKGCVLIYDKNANLFYSNDFGWAKKGQLPASTFKIPNSMIALELGILEDTSSILLWDGEPQMNPLWEQDLKLKDAFQFSCVPCYRSIARQVGVDRMVNYVHQFNYGQMVIDSSNLDLFWLMGDSKISPFEEIAFLKAFNEKALKIEDKTYRTMRYILLREDTGQYQLYGKTGWSTDNDHNNTWFVGFLETTNNTYYFATNLEPTDQANLDKLASHRINITKSALNVLGQNLTY